MSTKQIVRRASALLAAGAFGTALSLTATQPTQTTDANVHISQSSAASTVTESVAFKSGKVNKANSIAFKAGKVNKANSIAFKAGKVNKANSI